MKVYIAMRSRGVVPKMSELVSHMWAPGITFSYFRTGEDMYDSACVNIKWDKWLDNPQWRGQPRGTEYINFEWTRLGRARSAVSPEFHRLCRASQADNVLAIEMADEAVAMDRRAFARAVYLLSRRTEGLIYIPVQRLVLDADQYYERNRDLIDSEFSMALEPD